MSAQEAYQEAKLSMPKLGLATAYRVIKEMIEEKFIKAVSLPGDAQRYEVTRQDHHHYFQCTGCDKVFDVAGCPGNIAKIAPPGFEVHAHEVILYGHCEGCV